MGDDRDQPQSSSIHPAFGNGFVAEIGFWETTQVNFRSLSPAFAAAERVDIAEILNLGIDLSVGDRLDPYTSGGSYGKPNQPGPRRERSSCGSSSAL